jgi:hypothetical protein
MASRSESNSFALGVRRVRKKSHLEAPEVAVRALAQRGQPVLDPRRQHPLRQGPLRQDPLRQDHSMHDQPFQDRP